MNKAVIILGMHRSGTSVLAGLLSLLGLNPGRDLMPSHKDINPRGFWEHAELVKIHEEILNFFGSSWDDVSDLPDNWWKDSKIAPFKLKLVEILKADFSDNLTWLIKDPRLCRLLPVWFDVLHEIHCTPLIILSIRNPVEVSSSLYTRDGIVDDEASLLWLTYTIEAEKWSRGKRRILINYENILSDWRSASAAIEEKLGVNLPGNDPEIAAQIDKFIDPDLNHYMSSPGDSKKPGTPADLATLTYNKFCTIPLEKLPDELAQVNAQLIELRKKYYPLVESCRKLRKRIDSLKRENDVLSHYKFETNRIKATVSWQITKPLRFCAFLARQLKRATSFKSSGTE